jgi:formate-dependent nitrite reductase cytochrome c552 subunit
MPKIKITVEGYKCLRCGAEWVPRSKGSPKVCPKCHSPYWDTPRRIKNKTS